MANDRIEQYLEAILEKLNDGTETGVPVPAWRIEQYLAAIYDKCGGGSGGGVLVVNGTWNDLETELILDKTWQEIHDGGFGVVKMPTGDDIAYMPIINVYVGFGGSSYGVVTIQEGDEYIQAVRFIASSASGYPVLSLS